MPKKVEIAIAAVVEARSRFHQYYKTERLTDSERRFRDFLGLTTINLLGVEMLQGDFVYLMPEDAANKIAALNSPHWQTLLKAIEARKQ